MRQRTVHQPTSRTVAKAVAVALLLSALCAGALSACGGSSDSGASKLAQQRELSEARRQAAQDVRQSEHIKELERRLKSIAGQRDASDPESAPSSATTEQPLATSSSTTGDWPGGTGFTAILGSLSTEAEAVATQTQATARGLDAGVLYSSNFSSLRPGYWVVFSGSFSDVEGASTRTTRAHELGYTDAYPRFVSP
jgi:hypothetical protein